MPRIVAMSMDHQSRETDLPAGAENDDRGPSLVIFSSFMIAISVTAVTLRLISRGLVQRGQRFWWDDWVALLSLPFILGLMGTILGMVSHGLGRRAKTVPGEDLLEFGKVLFAGYFAYDIALALTKCSALLFFSRIFPRRQSSAWFTWCLYGIHALNASWLIGILVGTVMICQPVAKNWLTDLPGHCGPPSSLWIGSAVPSAFIDLLILLLPLPKVWSLQLSKARRLGIIGIFMLGYCVIIVSVGRLITTFLKADAMDADVTYEIPPVLFWVGAEAPVTLLCICLPAMLPLFRQVASKFSSRFKPYTEATAQGTQDSALRSRSGNFRGVASSNNEGVHMRSMKSFVKEEESIRSEGSSEGILPGQVTTARGGWPESDASMPAVPGRAIRVEREIRVDRY